MPWALRCAYSKRSDGCATPSQMARECWVESVERWETDLDDSPWLPKGWKLNEAGGDPEAGYFTDPEGTRWEYWVEESDWLEPVTFHFAKIPANWVWCDANRWFAPQGIALVSPFGTPKIADAEHIPEEYVQFDGKWVHQDLIARCRHCGKIFVLDNGLADVCHCSRECRDADPRTQQALIQFEAEMRREREREARKAQRNSSTEQG